MSNSDHTMFGWRIDPDGIVTVTIDDPDQSTNTMNDRFRNELPVLVDHLYAERERITGVVLTSGKRTFLAGGDLSMMMRAAAEDRPRIRALVDDAKSQLRRLETLGRPIVAVVAGAALGGGYELALACHHRIAIDSPGTVVGLPEVTLGLIPGTGGVVRAVRLLGLLPALQDVLTTGARFRPAGALEKSLVDEVVSDLASGTEAAKRWIAEHPEPVQPWDGEGFTLPGGDPSSPGISAILPSLPASLRARTRGAPASAQGAVLAAAVEGAQVHVDNAMIIESRYVTDLICGKESGNIIKAMFYDMQSINRGANRPDGVPAHEATKVVVVGAGMMGAGIAYVAAKAGLDVVLKDISLEAAERGKDHSVGLLDKAVSKGRSTAEQRDEVLARIHPAGDAADAAGADVAIEAVFEDASLKKQVLGEVLPFLAPDAVLASNTSTLPITGLAEGVPRPEHVIGTHFFSPVDKMTLLEIVVGEKTSDVTLARTIDLARRLGKTPIVVNDSRGFFTSRVISEFMDEAIAMVGEGVPAASVEQAASQAGYPVGALALVDEVSLTLNRQIRHQTSAARRDDGTEKPPHPAAPVIDRMIDEFGRGGRLAGGGFHEYRDGRKIGLWSGLAREFGSSTVVPMRDMQERMLFAEAIDAVRCLDESVLRSVADANVGSILGIGFPAWTGGVLQYVNQYDGGLAGFVARARELAERYGRRFSPPASLVRRAEAKESF